MVFRFFVHICYWLSITGLVFTGLVIIIHSCGLRDLAKIIGLYEYRNIIVIFLIAGLILGFSLGVLYRLTYKMTMIPRNLTLMAFTAPAIGITEELVFRGFIQGTVTRVQGWKGIIFSSGSHTIYKLLIIWSFPYDLGINLLNIVLLTFSVGMLLGWLRKTSENIIPPALAHGCFDIMIYGSLKFLPVWVWH